MEPRKVMVVGAGMGGLGTAALLARQGHKVTVVEKNPSAGGRASVWESGGFRFDLGPSWYLMPDVFERFFRALGTSAEQELDLVRLAPAYKVQFGPEDHVDVPVDLEEAYRLFESFEPGGGAQLRRYLEQAARQYDIAMSRFLYRDFIRLAEFLDPGLILEGARLQVLRSLDDHVSTFFKSDRARKILEYSMVFLGGSPKNTPALYSLMSHVDMGLGVWYPMGGMSTVVDAVRRLAEQAGVEFLFSTPVREITVKDGRATGLDTDAGHLHADVVVANADYHHVETALLAPEHRQYSDKWWDSRVVAPSAFILCLGLDRRLDNLAHHNLFLGNDWVAHFNAIFDAPAWPEQPSYYVCAPSRTDPSVAPRGYENLFVLVPVAAGLDDTQSIRDTFRTRILADLEIQVGTAIQPHIQVERVFSLADFRRDYNAFKGTALGLAHTLRQTALFRPRRRSSKVRDLYFTGQYTQPGIGVPMTLISAQIVARELAA